MLIYLYILAFTAVLDQFSLSGLKEQHTRFQTMAVDLEMQKTAKAVAAEWSTLENWFMDCLHHDWT